MSDVFNPFARGKKAHEIKHHNGTCAGDDIRKIEFPVLFDIDRRNSGVKKVIHIFKYTFPWRLCHQWELCRFGESRMYTMIYGVQGAKP